MMFMCRRCLGRYTLQFLLFVLPTPPYTFMVCLIWKVLNTEQTDANTHTHTNHANPPREKDDVTNHDGNKTNKMQVEQSILLPVLHHALPWQFQHFPIHILVSTSWATWSMKTMSWISHTSCMVQYWISDHLQVMLKAIQYLDVFVFIWCIC